MRKKLNFAVIAHSEEVARKKAEEWYANMPNLTVDEVTPYTQGSYQVWISFDMEIDK